MNWTQYFIQIAEVVSQKTTCLRRQVGAVLVKDRHIIATGYNGAPAGLPHCDVVGCIRAKRNIASGEHHELCRGVHAEQNAVIQAAYHGVSTKGAALYCTHFPCGICAKILINAGIREIYYKHEYKDPTAVDYFNQASIPYFKI